MKPLALLLSVRHEASSSTSLRLSFSILKKDNKTYRVGMIVETMGWEVAFDT